jgi:hypothetical protein
MPRRRGNEKRTSIAPSREVRFTLFRPQCTNAEEFIYIREIAHHTVTECSIFFHEARVVLGVSTKSDVWLLLGYLPLLMDCYSILVRYLRSKHPVQQRGGNRTNTR